MTPATIEEKKRVGLTASREDVLWLIELSEALAKGLAAIGPDRDFRCPACGQDSEAHGKRCPIPLAEAVLGERWRVV